MGWPAPGGRVTRAWAITKPRAHYKAISTSRRQLSPLHITHSTERPYRPHESRYRTNVRRHRYRDTDSFTTAALSKCSVVCCESKRALSRLRRQHFLVLQSQPQQSASFVRHDHQHQHCDIGSGTRDCIRGVGKIASAFWRATARRATPARSGAAKPTSAINHSTSAETTVARSPSCRTRPWATFTNPSSRR